MQDASTSQQPQQGTSTWTAPGSFPTHQRSTSNSGYPEGDRRDDSYPDYQQQQSYPSQPGYNPMTYYPNQTLTGYRRTSNPKAATPPASAPVIPTAASPSSQYYSRPNEYPPSSAPAHLTHPQTAHPYGTGYYPNYYDYNSQNHARQSSGASTTPTLAPTAQLGERSPADFSPGYYDPRQYQGRPQQYYPQQQYFQWPGYGYPPPQQSMPQSAPMQTPHSAPLPGGPPSKKIKKDDGLVRKRSTDGEVQEDKKDNKKKKVKKEEVLPKPPVKSHLHPPRQAQSAWQLFFTDELNRAKAAAQTSISPGGTPLAAKLNVAQIAKDAGAAYATLDDERKSYYSVKVQESKDQYAKDLLAWQSTLTPEDIRLENAFRAQQRKDGKSRKGNLKDPNAPKKPLSAYFLFLKSIREDDDLRSRVWGDESETTKQSVLAAERWRGLSDMEKKPYLQRAEKDKQDYEGARKLYEDDAAARARGEAVPDRAHVENHSVHIEAPLSLKVAKKELDIIPPPVDAPFEHFAAFDDPLSGLDLPGLEVPDTQDHWDDLHNLIGDGQKLEDKEAKSQVEETEVYDPKEAEAFESMSAFIADPID